ncbi:hypothetical protein [Streptomyces aureoverticillatus]|uniref:hypothetical protein n=1 Tax=Streptomyces aureoverticillatus TaxID=66871 RepID=UPI0013DA9837|nr:hypothetical protein [Streptomyces aureoverticillatus]QIB47746.1 hypothetical protein G3H79_36380 [Streptomyces aureoverticillatus]
MHEAMTADGRAKARRREQVREHQAATEIRAEAVAAPSAADVPAVSVAPTAVAPAPRPAAFVRGARDRRRPRRDGAQSGRMLEHAHISLKYLALLITGVL